MEFLRGTDHPVAIRLRDLINGEEPVAVTDMIVMELLAGARLGASARDLRARLLAFPLLALEGLNDFEEAALIYRACRDAGETIRSLSDCLIAVPVIRARGSLLHNDADFDTVARHSALKVERL